jgi:hypothetical protein
MLSPELSNAASFIYQLHTLPASHKAATAARLIIPWDWRVLWRRVVPQIEEYFIHLTPAPTLNPAYGSKMGTAFTITTTFVAASFYGWHLGGACSGAGKGRPYLVGYRVKT